MASIEVPERIIENLTLNRATLGLMYHRVTKTGTLTELTLYRSIVGGISGTWYFNVKVNGASLFAGTGRLLFNLGIGVATKTGLSIAVTAGDVVQVDLEQVGGGLLLGNLTLITKYAVDDAVVNGPSSATSNGIVLFDATTGKLIKDSGKTISTDDTLSSDSDLLIPTQKAVKKYVDDNVGGGSGIVESVVEGPGILVDATDPANPIVSADIECMAYACSDDNTTDLTTGVKITDRMPYDFEVVDIRASLSTVSSSGAVTVVVKKNGTTICSTELTIDASEKTSVTAATPVVISSGSFSDDDELTIEVSGAGTGAKGLKVRLYGNRG